MSRQTNHTTNETQPQRTIHYSELLQGLESLLNEGLQYVTDTDTEWAIAHESIHDVELTLEVTNDWRYQYTLIAGNEVCQTPTRPKPHTCYITRWRFGRNKQQVLSFRSDHATHTNGQANTTG